MLIRKAIAQDWEAIAAFDCFEHDPRSAIEEARCLVAVSNVRVVGDLVYLDRGG